MHDNPSTVRDNHVLLARTLASALPELTKVGTALALVERGANIFKIDKNKVAFWMETAAAQGQWKLVDFFVYQLSNLQVVRSSSGAPSDVVKATSFKYDRGVSDAQHHQPTECAYDGNQPDLAVNSHQFSHL